MSVPFAFSLEAILGNGDLNFRHYIAQDLIRGFMADCQEISLEPKFLGKPGRCSTTFTLPENAWTVLFEQRKFWVRGSSTHLEYGCIVPTHYPALTIQAHPVWRKGFINLTVPCSNTTFIESWKQFLQYRLGVYLEVSDLTEHRWKIMFPSENYPDVLESFGYNGSLRDPSFMKQFQTAFNFLFTEGAVSWSAAF